MLLNLTSSLAQIAHQHDNKCDAHFSITDTKSLGLKNLGLDEG